VPPYTTDRPRNYDNVGKPALGCKQVGRPARRGIQHFAQPLAIKRFYQQLVARRIASASTKGHGFRYVRAPHTFRRARSENAGQVCWPAIAAFAV
jgi:hypothetical protein